MQSSPGWWLVGLFLGATVACRNAEPAATKVIVLDSMAVAPFDEMAEIAWSFRVVVVGPRRQDTVSSVAAADLIVANDTMIAGVGILPPSEGYSSRDLFVLDRKSGSAWRRPIPPDAIGSFWEFAISPDGRYLAYVAITHDGNQAVVEELRSGKPVFKGSITTGCDCDVEVDHARWITSDSFEIATADVAGGHGWLLSTGSLKSGRRHSEVLANEPQWRGDGTPPKTPVPDTVMVDATRPTVVAYFLPTPAEVDSSGDLNEILSDYQFSLSHVLKELKEHGVEFKELAAHGVLLEQQADARLRPVPVPADDSDIVGYVLFKPGAVPRYIRGVRTDVDLSEEWRKFFQWP